MGSPAAPVGDPADLLDIHVDQLAGPAAFVAHRGCLGGSYDLPGERVARGKRRHVVAAQDTAHSARRDPEFRPYPVLPAAMLSTRGEHFGFDLDAGACRHAMRPRRPVEQTGVAFGIPTGNPTMGTLTRDTHRLRHMRHGPPLDTD